MVERYPVIEKLEAHSLINITHLKQTRLKYLRINGCVTNINEIIHSLPETIESLIIPDMLIMSPTDPLDKLPHLNYLKINLPPCRLSNGLSVSSHVEILSSQKKKQDVHKKGDLGNWN